MKSITDVSEVVNAKTIPPGSRIYTGGNAGTPQVLLSRLAGDASIGDVELLSVLLLGGVEDLFCEDACRRIMHRVIFNGPHSRRAINEGWATYQLIHLSDIPHQLSEYLHPDVVFMTVAGPDSGGNYSLGTNVEGIPAAVESARRRGGTVIAERNARMPFIFGTTIPEEEIDYLFDTEYDLPVSPLRDPDTRSMRIGRIIAEHFVRDGSTLQYGIGEVPSAVTDAILERGIGDLGIHTELFSDSMRRLIEEGAVTHRHTESNCAVSTLFLSSSQEGYDWLNLNGSVQGMPCDYTNSILTIAGQPKMVAVNSAIGVDLHGNIWADSIRSDKVYSGIGGQSDFLRGSYRAQGGIPIIAMKSTTEEGVSKIYPRSPEGITTTSIPADPVVIVTEHGAFNPRGLSIIEHAIGIAHLAEPETREKLMRHIYDSSHFHDPWGVLRRKEPKGFIPYEGP